MILDLINYSLDQNHSDFSIENIDSQLLKLNLKKKRFIIHYQDITSSGDGRNIDELGIQLTPVIKHKLIGYSGEDYDIILLGYHKITNTFTFWRYGSDIETNTKQLLYTQKKILDEAKLIGYSKYYKKKRNAFNNRNYDQRNSSVSINAFLFPLIIKYYDKIFLREFLFDFQDRIKRFNYPYSKDELLLSLGIYVKERNTINVTRTDPDLVEITNLCKLRFKLLGFYPLDKFYPTKDVPKFRNSNGISTKTQNFKSTDPNTKGGYPGGARGPQKKIFEQYFKNNVLDKKKIIRDSNNLKKNILSKNIEILIGKKLLVEKNYSKDFSYNDIVLDIENISDLSNFVLDKPYENRVIDPDNFSDRIESLNLIDKSNKLHEITVNKLAHIFNKKKCIIKKDRHIDFYTEFKNRGKLFEVKSFNKHNFNQQIRHGIVQLREYYFVYAKFLKKIPLKTDLFLLLSDNPNKLIKDHQISFLKHEGITLCWILGEKIISFKNKELF